MAISIKLRGSWFPHIVISCFFILAGSASAKDFGHGRVGMRGEILDSACGVDTESQDQTVDMLVQPLSEVIGSGSGIPRPFSIRLVNCSLQRHSPNNLPVDDWQYFKVTFDGIRNHGAFGVEGNARGVALQIRDAQGNIANPGQALPAGNIEPGTMQLNYTLRLVGDGENLSAGSYHSTIRYKLDYY
ncbi:fimbrial protein [Klebsiella aerogenes]